MIKTEWVLRTANSWQIYTHSESMHIQNECAWSAHSFWPAISATVRYMISSCIQYADEYPTKQTTCLVFKMQWPFLSAFHVRMSFLLHIGQNHDSLVHLLRKRLYRVLRLCPALRSVITDRHSAVSRHGLKLWVSIIYSFIPKAYHKPNSMTMKLRESLAAL